MDQIHKPTVEPAEDAGIKKHTADQVLVDSDGRVQRLPIPSEDPNDPLNFTLWEKFGVIVSCCWFCE